MPPSTSSRRDVRSAASVERRVTTSGGTQNAPRQKMGTPLTERRERAVRPVDLDRPESDRPHIQVDAVDGQADGVERLGAVCVRPPPLGVGDPDGGVDDGAPVGFDRRWPSGDAPRRGARPPCRRRPPRGAGGCRRFRRLPRSAPCTWRSATNGSRRVDAGEPDAMGPPAPRRAPNPGRGRAASSGTSVGSGSGGAGSATGGGAGAGRAAAPGRRSGGAARCWGSRWSTGSWWATHMFSEWRRCSPLSQASATVASPSSSSRQGPRRSPPARRTGTGTTSRSHRADPGRHPPNATDRAPAALPAAVPGTVAGSHDWSSADSVARPRRVRRVHAGIPRSIRPGDRREAASAGAGPIAPFEHTAARRPRVQFWLKAAAALPRNSVAVTQAFRLGERRQIGALTLVSFAGEPEVDVVFVSRRGTPRW